MLLKNEHQENYANVHVNRNSFSFSETTDDSDKVGKTSSEQSRKSRAQPVKNTVKTVGKYKLTVVFLIITVFFVVCYVPKVILLILEGLNSNFPNNLSNRAMSLVKWFGELYILNNIINPFIYAFLDTKFQTECKNFFKF